MPESENNHRVSKRNFSQNLSVMRATFIALFVSLGLVTHGQSSIERYFLRVEQHNDACTFHYIAEDKMYNSHPHQLTISYKKDSFRFTNTGEMKVVFQSVKMTSRALNTNQPNESSGYELENEDTHFSISENFIRIDAPYSISSATIKSVGGRTRFIEQEVTDSAFLLDLSGFNTGFYTLEIAREAFSKKPRH